MSDYDIDAYNAARKRLQEAITSMLDEGEIAIHWVLIAEIAGPNNTRYLAHRAGGGIDGSEAPMTWTAYGMLRASMDVAAQQLLQMTFDLGEDEESEE